MRIIRKYFKTLEEAEQFQNSLYDDYDFVRLVKSPRFSEDGYYTWEVE